MGLRGEVRSARWCCIVTPTEREPTAESRTGMTPMDTTRDALAYDAFWDEWRKTHDSATN
jgi:hypothetical protein